MSESQPLHLAYFDSPQLAPSVVPVISGRYIHLLTWTRRAGYRLWMEPNALQRIMKALEKGSSAVMQVLESESVPNKAAMIRLLDILQDAGFLARSSRTENLDESSSYSAGLLSFLRELRVVLAEASTCSSFESSKGDEERLSMARVIILGSGNTAEETLRALTRLGIKCDTIDSLEGEKAELLLSDKKGTSAKRIADYNLAVAVGDTFCLEDYRRINRACLATHTPWIRYRILGGSAEIGPLVLPFVSPCYECFLLRQEEAMTVMYRGWTSEEYKAVHHLPPLPSSLALGHEFLVSDMLRTLVGIPAVTCGKLCTVDLITYNVRFHPLLRSPRCICADHRTRPVISWDILR